MHFSFIQGRVVCQRICWEPFVVVVIYKTSQHTAQDTTICLQQVGLLRWVTAQCCPRWGEFISPGGLFLIPSHTAPDLSSLVRQERL